MIDHIFRQYDIRGKIDSELAIDEIYDLGKAIAYYFVHKNPLVKKVAVGADGRIHSPAIKSELCKALVDSGLDVVFIGTCPSPVLYFALHALPVDAGLMITASHNGKEYNGLKICLGKESVWGDQIQEIRQLVHTKASLKSSRKGIYEEYNLIKDYVDAMSQQFPHLIGMNRSIVIDCGNGAAGTVWPLLIEKMKWPQAILLFAEVDGNYPHHEADPIVEENMRFLKKQMLSGLFDVGIGLDGDCDRMAPMTRTGELVLGDKMLALFSHDILADNPGATVVFDVKCSSGLSELLLKWGGVPCMSATGHSIIKDQLKKNNALLAGELSCHFFFNDRYFGYDDANYAALRLFELLEKTGKPLEKLLEVFPQKFNTPEIRIMCEQEQMKTIIEKVKHDFFLRADATVMTLDGIRVTMDYGWGMLRASNTQPVLCLRFESGSPEGLYRIKQDFIDALKPYFKDDVLMRAVN